MRKIVISCSLFFLVLAAEAQDTTLKIDNGSFTLTDAIVRNNFDTNIENIELIDEFYHPKKKQISRCYRMTLNPMLDLNDPGEFFKICNKLMIDLRDQIIDKLQLEVRG